MKIHISILVFKQFWICSKRRFLKRLIIQVFRTFQRERKRIDMVSYR